MSEPVKKKRIRSSDLVKSARCVGESKYDFSKIIKLKGATGRDVSKKGRPEGITSTASHVQETSSTSMIVANEDADQEDIVTFGSFDLQCQLDPENVSVLSADDVYLNLLKENCGIFCSDNGYRTFVLKEFDSKRLQLKATQFLFVSRRAMSFEGDFHWIYTCSCDVAGTELIECCGQQMEVTFADFKARIPGCIHTNVVGTLLEQFDAQNMINPNDSEEIEDDSTINAGDNEESVEEEITELNDGLFLIKSSKGLGVVLQGQSGTKCLTCNASVVKCKHLEMFINSRGEREKESNTNRSYQQRCYSLAKISFNSNFGMQETYKKELTDRFLVEDDVISLKPEVEMCDVCGIILTEKEDKITANIFMMNKVLKANVSVKQCSGCEKQFHFDGLDQCILNMGRNVFCHEILRRFMYYFLSGKSTIFTEYQVLCQTLSDAGYVDIGEKMTYQDFKCAWYAFLDLLDINYENSFQCPHCGPDPDTVVMDATSVAFRKELISWKSLFTDEKHDSKPCDTFDPDRVRERTFFSRMVRKFFTDYLKPSRGISNDEKEKMFNLIKAENQESSILDLIIYIFDDSMVRGERLFAKDIWRDLLKALSSSYPACGFFPPSEDFFDFLHGALSCKENLLNNDVQLSEIQMKLPVIFKLLKGLKSKFPFETFQNCLDFFQQKTFDPFLKETCPSETPDEEDGLAYFPQLPKQRKRGFFVADKKGSKSKEDFCSKFSKGHPSLLPGVFTMFCPHGVCYGFQVMKLHESPDVPFTLLRTRFTRAPKLVIYDNACSLHAYCLNRDPVFFSNTTFRVDALHFKNHKACGPGYELKRYPQHVHLNSQVVEQANSRLQRIKGSLSYMTQTNFIKHCKLYVWGQNETVVSKL